LSPAPVCPTLRQSLAASSTRLTSTMGASTTAARMRRDFFNATFFFNAFSTLLSRPNRDPKPMQHTLWGKKAILSTVAADFKSPKTLTTGDTGFHRVRIFKVLPCVPLCPLLLNQPACQAWYGGKRNRGGSLWKLFIPQYLLHQ